MADGAKAHRPRPQPPLGLRATLSRTAPSPIVVFAGAAGTPRSVALGPDWMLPVSFALKPLLPFAMVALRSTVSRSRCRRPLYPDRGGRARDRPAATIPVLPFPVVSLRIVSWSCAHGRQHFWRAPGDDDLQRPRP